MRKDLGLSDRTAHNRRTNVLTFLKAYGVEKLLLKKDKVRFVAQMPETYEDADLRNSSTLATQKNGYFSSFC
jgi:hypothetical protein